MKSESEIVNFNFMFSRERAQKIYGGRGRCNTQAYHSGKSNPTENECKSIQCFKWKSFKYFATDCHIKMLILLGNLIKCI